jgi:hypothetical protein
MVFKPDPKKNNTSSNLSSLIIDDPNVNLTSKNVQQYFTVPYGFFYSVEIKSQADKKFKTSCLSIIMKDHRAMNFTLSSYENCCTARDRIKIFAFPEHHPLLKI